MILSVSGSNSDRVLLGLQGEEDNVISDEQQILYM